MAKTARSQQTRVFINYRREDSGAAAEHLHASLSQQYGADSVFRDLVSIQPGQDYPAVIDAAIRRATVLVVLIGRRWLAAKDRGGHARLENPMDFVRLEIESALKLGIGVIPVLVDGATMPSAEELPASLAELSKRNAHVLPWHDGVVRLQTAIGVLEREQAERDAAKRAEAARLDLTRGKRVWSTQNNSKTVAQSIAVVARAMELSLAHQGHRTVLDQKDLAASIKKIDPPSRGRWVMFPDLVYIIDVIGVKEKRSARRFVARSYPLQDFDEVPAHLQLGRPILASLMITEGWFSDAVTKSGVIDGRDMGAMQGGVVGAVIGWDPVAGSIRVLTPWPTWGDKGLATITADAIPQALPGSDFRAIEAALRPVPYTESADTIIPSHRRRR